jgi:ferredoxin-NADP reductase
VARTAVSRRLIWRPATVAETVVETPYATTLVLDVEGWPGHRAGQHVDVRLTAGDGYQAQRSYSIASAPGEDRLRLTVEVLDDGEVSPWLGGFAEPGDQFEVRGPIGGYFVWDGEPGPLTLVAGGSGIVPLMAILRHRVATGVEAPVRLLYSARSLDRLIYYDELREIAERAPRVDVGFALTREAPDGWEGFRRRVDGQTLRRVAWPPGDAPTAFVCGPTGFVERMASELLAYGYDPAAVKTERFGATG